MKNFAERVGENACELLFAFHLDRLFAVEQVEHFV